MGRRKRVSYQLKNRLQNDSQSDRDHRSFKFSLSNTKWYPVIKFSASTVWNLLAEKEHINKWKFIWKLNLYGSSFVVEECSRPMVPRLSWDDCRAKQNTASSPCDGKKQSSYLSNHTYTIWQASNQSNFLMGPFTY